MKEKKNHQSKKQSNGVLSPPPNFSKVEDGFFRSALPQSANFSFIQSLNLKTIINLCPEAYPEENKKFVNLNNIQLFQFGIDDNKDSANSRETFIQALKILIDARNHPLLIHCIVGKNWSMPRVADEYKLFAGSKWKETDVKFIEKFEVFADPLPEENAEQVYVFGVRGEQAIWLCNSEGNRSEAIRSIQSFQ